MSWAALLDNQTISFNNLQDAVTTGVFALKNTIPSSLEQITKADADFYVFINTSFGPYASKASNQLVVKSNLQSPSPCDAVEFLNLEVSTGGTITYIDCDSSPRTSTVGAGPDTIGVGHGVLVSTLGYMGGTAIYTIDSYGPCCGPPPV